MKHENCVTKCLQGTKSMHECIRICQTQELICKCLKVASKNKSSQATLKNLKQACFLQAQKCIEVCSSHKERHCINCVKENEKIVEYLKK